jgi:hypothetical protein
LAEEVGELDFVGAGVLGTGGGMREPFIYAVIEQDAVDQVARYCLYGRLPAQALIERFFSISGA